MTNIKDPDIGKMSAAVAAVEFIQDGMFVGLGTGSTAAYFITLLGERCRSGLNISAVATSTASEEQAQSEGIPIIDINSRTALDIAVDGADEIDPKKRLIKGGGGALFREKIVAGMSREFIVIADETKLVKHFGSFPLATEISPFAYSATLTKLEKLGYPGALRKNSNGEFFITENGNYIVDIRLPHPCTAPENDDEQIQCIPGVIETGFFFNMAGRIFIGFSDNHVEIF